MNIISLEQAGWKRICPKSAAFVEDIKRVLNDSGYNTVESDDSLLCQPLVSVGSPIKKIIDISGTLDKQNYF